VVAHLRLESLPSVSCSEAIEDENGFVVRKEAIDSSDRPIASGEFEVRDLPALIRLPLPPQQEICVKILAAGEAGSR
jgi:hypothetical protein